MFAAKSLTITAEGEARGVNLTLVLVVLTARATRYGVLRPFAAIAALHFCLKLFVFGARRRRPITRGAHGTRTDGQGRSALV
jgi:hypothetical protein